MAERRRNAPNKDEKKEEKAEGIDYLDTTEQKEFIKRMRDENAKQNRWSRLVFTLISLVLAAGKGYYALSQYYYPWALQPHNDWVDRTSPQTVFLMESLSTIAFLLCGLTTNPWIKADSAVIKTWTLLFAMLSGALNLYLFYFVAGFELSMHALWFVGLNTLFIAVAYYVEWLVRYSEREVAMMEAYQYNFQKP